jgi:hypothetical protein
MAIEGALRQVLFGRNRDRTPDENSSLEGIVSKRKDSLYRSDRSPDWLKMKNANAPARTQGFEQAGMDGAVFVET